MNHPKADNLYVTSAIDAIGNQKRYADIEHEQGDVCIMITAPAAHNLSDYEAHRASRAFANRVIRALRVLDSIETSLND